VGPWKSRRQRGRRRGRRLGSACLCRRPRQRRRHRECRRRPTCPRVCRLPDWDVGSGATRTMRSGEGTEKGTQAWTSCQSGSRTKTCKKNSARCLKTAWRTEYRTGQCVRKTCTKKDKLKGGRPREPETKQKHMQRKKNWKLNIRWLTRRSGSHLALWPMASTTGRTRAGRGSVGARAEDVGVVGDGEAKRRDRERR